MPEHDPAIAGSAYSKMPPRCTQWLVCVLIFVSLLCSWFPFFSYQREVTTDPKDHEQHPVSWQRFAQHSTAFSWRLGLLSFSIIERIKRVMVTLFLLAQVEVPKAE